MIITEKNPAAAVYDTHVDSVLPHFIDKCQTVARNVKDILVKKDAAFPFRGKLETSPGPTSTSLHFHW